MEGCHEKTQVGSSGDDREGMKRIWGGGDTGFPSHRVLKKKKHKHKAFGFRQAKALETLGNNPTRWKG